MVSSPYVETYSLELVADSLALFVTLTSGECRGRRVSTVYTNYTIYNIYISRFSDNGFLVTGPITHLSFYSRQQISVEQLQNCVALTHYKL